MGRSSGIVMYAKVVPGAGILQYFAKAGVLTGLRIQHRAAQHACVRFRPNDATGCGQRKFSQLACRLHYPKQYFTVAKLIVRAMSSAAALLTACAPPSEESIAEALLDPAAYSERTTRIDCLETHISRVFLTQQFAYKLKKRVRFKFLDFSTLRLRERACREELRLNRRLAPRVYLNVLPVTNRGGHVRIGLPGEVVDWVVKMQRLPADASLDRLIVENRVCDAVVDRVARRLAQFYQDLPPISMEVKDYCDGLFRHMQENEKELLAAKHSADAATIQRIHEAQRRYIVLSSDLIASRVVDGRIVEGHGDLRPEHIYLTPTPAIIDCIEFSPEFRTLDVADELGFLAMECEKLDARWIGERVLECYCQRCLDTPPAELMSFYKSYRACVRAKVTALREAQMSNGSQRTAGSSWQEYLQLGKQFADDLGRPLLIAVSGRSGTGKSTLAEAVARRLGMTHLQTDAIRQELLGGHSHKLGYGEFDYDSNSRNLTYQAMMRRADALLAQGRSAVVDGTFLRSTWRNLVLEAADRHNAQTHWFHCDCPEELALQRILTRAQQQGVLSAASKETFEQQGREEEAWGDLPKHTIDTSAPVPLLANAAFAEIRASYLQGP